MLISCSFFSSFNTKLDDFWPCETHVFMAMFWHNITQYINISCFSYVVCCMYTHVHTVCCMYGQVPQNVNSGVDGCIKKTQDLHPGHSCLSPVWHQKSTLTHYKLHNVLNLTIVQCKPRGWRLLVLSMMIHVICIWRMCWQMSCKCGGLSILM